MPSFDVVCEANMVEIKNAVEQANKEITTRFDFKGSDARVEQKEGELTAFADDDFKLGQVKDVLINKMAKRNVDVRFLDYGKVEKISGDKVKQVITIKKGVTGDLAKKIVRMIKDSKIKVQGSIQGDAVRVSGTKRDDLQSVIAMLRKDVSGAPLDFNTSGTDFPDSPDSRMRRYRAGAAPCCRPRSARLRQPADLRAGTDTLLREPSLVHFQRVADRCLGAVVVLRLRRHVLDIDDAAVIGKEGDRQRQVGVLHPEAVSGLLLEYKQHAGVGRHRLAVHQPLLAGGRGGCDFCLDSVHAGGERHDRQGVLGVSHAADGGGQRHAAEKQGLRQDSHGNAAGGSRAGASITHKGAD